MTYLWLLPVHCDPCDLRNLTISDEAQPAIVILAQFPTLGVQWSVVSSSQIISSYAQSVLIAKSILRMTVDYHTKMGL